MIRTIEARWDKLEIDIFSIKLEIEIYCFALPRSELTVESAPNGVLEA